MNIKKLTSKIHEGDIIFSSVPNFLYQCIEKATDSPTSHVGIILKKDNQWVVAESRVPFVCYTPLRDFIKRSKNEWVSIKRYKRPLSESEVETMKTVCAREMGRLYHLGFNYNSNRQFCSKFVHDAYQAIGIDIGSLATFEELLNQNPATPKTFWRFWYFGFIPWNRLTVTPASQYCDPKLLSVT